MVYSMTGYASLTRDVGGASMQVELRSVNSRYLDLAFRIFEDLRFTEPAVRELINASVTRGKVECRIGLQTASSHEINLGINATLLDQLGAVQDKIRTLLPDAIPLSVNEILRWPGLLAEQSPDPEALQAAVLAAVKEAIADFKASRGREGAKLAQMLRDCLSQMRTCVATAAPLVPTAIADYRERLSQRLREAVATLDEDRIRQEVTLFAQRADIAEEITRLETHLDEVERILDKGGAVGRRLDFLMQELNREANTLGSKAVAPQLTDISVNLKVYIEQMREQVQNLE